MLAYSTVWKRVFKVTVLQVEQLILTSLQASPVLLTTFCKWLAMYMQFIIKSVKSLYITSYHPDNYVWCHLPTLIFLNLYVEKKKHVCYMDVVWTSILYQLGLALQCIALL